ncbi:MAG TPA: hypothetical protein ENO22_09765 [candidate division Zixibacteria bacterium]|nr:hypothetical protein [candidate division Zixibacteria bacterium]
MKILKHFKAPLRVLVVFLLLILLLYILATQTTLLERLAVKIFQGSLGNKYNLQLSVGDLGGSLISGITVKDLLIHYDSEDTLFQVARIEKLDLSYSLTDIWRGRWILSRAVLDHPEIGLRSDLLRQFEGNGGEDEENGRPQFKIEELIIRSASLKHFDREEPLIFDSLQLFSFIDMGEDSIHLRIDSSSVNLSIIDRAVEELRGHFVHADTILLADSAYVRAVESEVLLSARLTDLDSLEYNADLYRSHFDLAQIGALLDAELEGFLDIQGEVWGKADHVNGDIALNGDLFGNHLSQITTEVEFNSNQLFFTNLQGGALNSTLQGNAYLDLGSSPNEYIFSGRMQDFNLNSLIENTFETSFTGELTLDGRSFSEEDLEMAFKVYLDSGYFDVYEFDSVYGYARVYMDSIVFDEPLTVLKERAKITASGVIDYEGTIDISGHGEFENLDPLMALINLQDMDISGSGNGDFNFYGPVDNPHLNAEFSSDSLNAYGMLSDSVDLDLNLRTFAAKLDGKMRVWSGTFHYGEYKGDSIFSEVVFDSNLMVMDTIRIYSERLNGRLAVNLEFTDTLTRISLPVMNLELDTFSFVNRDTISIAYSDSAVLLRSLKLETNRGMLEAEGGYFQNGGMDFGFSCSNLNLEPIFDFYIPAEELAGIFGFDASMSGTLQDPQFMIQGTVDSLEVYGNRLGNMYFDISYSNSLISVDSLYLEGDSNMMRVTGTIPYDLAFTDVEDRLIPDEKIDLEVGSRVTSYYLLPVVLPDIEWMEGDNALDLKVGGTPNDPAFSGHYYLRGGRIKVYYLQDPLENVNADISFEGRNVVIEKIVTTRKNGSKKRIAQASGTLTFDDLLSPTIDINVTADDFPIKYDLGEVSAVIDEADINVKGQDTITATGSVKLASLLYAEPLAPEIESGAIEASDTGSAFNYIIDITAPSNIIVEGPDFTVELSGDLRVFKQGNFTNFYGRMETIRGEYNLFGQRFEILEGGELIFDDIEEFNPRLNIVVETYMMAQGERLTARILISGTLQEPNLGAAEGSQVSENQFYEYMTFQRVQGQEGEGASTAFGQRITEGITDFALGRLSRYFGQQIGLDVVELDPAYEGEELSLQQSRLKVGMYTTPGLFIYGTTQLDFSRAHEVGFEYRFSRHFYLSGHRDEENLYHLNVNLDWNF